MHVYKKILYQKIAYSKTFLMPEKKLKKSLGYKGYWEYRRYPTLRRIWIILKGGIYFVPESKNYLK